MSGTAEVLGRLLASVRVMWRDVEGVPLAGDAESTWSRSIGVEAIVAGIRCLGKGWWPGAIVSPIASRLMKAPVPVVSRTYLVADQ